ncbi:hypothetical protein PT7_1231 [Pusillimonas sp. T7-7]|nr:hypothetical protein PT7_1231 [Pusillimonas sp. T7-7]
MALVSSSSFCMSMVVEAMSKLTARQRADAIGLTSCLQRI